MVMESGQAANALLTEHLQYTPLSLIDDIIDSVNNLVYQGVGSLETGLFATLPERLGFKATAKDSSNTAQADDECPEAKQEIEEGLHKLETLLNSTVDKNFDKFEIYVLRNILSVPQDLVNWIQLNHYEGINYPPPTDAPTAASIESLRAKLVASRRVNRALQTEHRRNEAMLTQLKNMVGSIEESSHLPNLSFLRNDNSMQTFANQSQRPLTANTTFAISQLPAMRSIVTELQGQLATLRKQSLDTNRAKDELREERREYIEQRTKQHLQNNGQATSEVEAFVGSDAVDTAELEALERAIGIFDQTQMT